MTGPRICDDEALLVDYLYDECEDPGRSRLEAHLATCAACRTELDGLRATRAELTAWSPPDAAGDAWIGGAARSNMWSRPLGRRRMVRWGLAAAAVLVLAAGVAIASLRITLGPDGLVIRTGRRSLAPVVSATDAQPWRAELATLERRLQAKIAASQMLRAPAQPEPSSAEVPPTALSEDDVMRRIRTAVRESEDRQQRELALRMAQLTRELDTQRRSDLVRIERGLGQLQGTTGAEVARQRELLNYLVRVSQRR